MEGKSREAAILPKLAESKAEKGTEEKTGQEQKKEGEKTAPEKGAGASKAPKSTSKSKGSKSTPILNAPKKPESTPKVSKKSNIGAKRPSRVSRILTSLGLKRVTKTSLPVDKPEIPYDPTIVQETYFHGLLPRPDMKDLLKKEGDFLVRTSEPKAGEARQYILSVMVNPKDDENGIKHFVLHYLNGKFAIEKAVFPSVKALIDYHFGIKKSVTEAASVILVKAIGRGAWEKRHEDITIEKSLGKGAFGEVYSGKMKKSNGTSVPVAIKLAKLEQLTKASGRGKIEQIKEVMHEARLLRNFDHPNIVKCYGVAALQEPLMVLMELAENGSLDSYLKKNVQSMEVKYKMMGQAALGIEYVHKNEVLHRDIAARNCLYGNGIVKIADFGLSREGTAYQMASNREAEDESIRMMINKLQDMKKRVPIRWISPDTLRTGVYTVKTDVWAFGILCWEIANNGEEPYPDMTVTQVNVEVRRGYRMPLPDDFEPEIATLVEKCWAEDAKERPLMSECVKAN